MDPVSAVGFFAAAVQLAGLCVTVSQSLNKVKGQFNEAQGTFSAITQYYSTIRITTEKIAAWVENTLVHSPATANHFAALQSAIDDVDKLFRMNGGKEEDWDGAENAVCAE
jgi:uncharacterized protein YoxC